MVGSPTQTEAFSSGEIAEKVEDFVKHEEAALPDSPTGTNRRCSRWMVGVTRAAHLHLACVLRPGERRDPLPRVGALQEVGP
jgi:hypothetical protein